jgi:two-component system cell cycle sensor histidine kinase/response regulator CckA
MSQSSATPRVQDRALIRWPAGASPDWATIGISVRGPLLTLAAAVVLDVLRRNDLGLIDPFPILFLTVMYSAYVGGRGPALVSVALTALDALHFFAQTGVPLHYSAGGVASLAAVVGATVAVAIVVSTMRTRIVHAQAQEVGRAEAEALDRRFSFLEQGSLLLSSPRDFDTMFRDLARLLVPTLADWCTIHLATEEGGLRFVAGAHREPARELVVRTLAEYGRRSLPFGETGTQTELRDVTEDLLRTSAEDDEQLKLYQALAPAAMARLPLLARDRLVGVVTLVMARETARSFTPEDVDLAEELARNTAVSVDNARLYEEARQASRRAQLLFDANPQPMWIFDADTLAFLAVNDAAVHHYGYAREDFLGMTIMDLLAPEEVAPVPAAIERGPHREEVALAHHRRRDGSITDMELASHELELDGRRARLVLAVDITERARTRAALHQSEEQLRFAQRGGSLGRIAGGVAHDFNNLLTTIRGFGEMLMLGLAPGDARRGDVERICNAADRGALLTRQLLSFGRNQAQEPRPVDLNEQIREITPLVRRLVGDDVTLDVRLASALGRVRIDPAQLEHVIVNLILAASDAMPTGGKLTIETAERRITGATGGQPVRPGRYVVLAIGDSGGGLDEAPGAEPATAGVAPRAVAGRSIVFGIVRQYGGVVRVSSESGEGTVVKVYLPRLADEAEVLPQGEHALRGTETVLVAEDEDGVRELLRKVLTEFGYRVHTARHGRDALLIAEEHAEDIDLLLTDVVMPEMGGGKLVETLTAQHPSLKVLVISGYTDDEILQRGVSGRELAFLRKPFAAEDLVRRVRAVLDTPAA